MIPLFCVSAEKNVFYRKYYFRSPRASVSSAYSPVYNGVYTLYLCKGTLRSTTFQTVHSDYIIQCMGTVGLVMRRCYLGVVIYRE